MSGVRILKLRRSTPAADVTSEGLKQGEAPSILLRPKSEPPTPSGPIPLEPPYDRQCIMRFPEDVAARVHSLLDNKKSTDSSEIIRITLDAESVNGHEFRLFSIQVFDNGRQIKEFDMKGILTDLPTYVESYKTVNNGVTLTKSSDVSQMMVCFKLDDFDVRNPSPELQKALNLLYPSGLTPPTSRIRYRKFRPPPSQEEVANLRSAEDLVGSLINEGSLDWVVETEVDEDEALQRSINEPETVWEPTEEILHRLREAGYLDGNGELVNMEEDESMIEGYAPLPYS
jgi:TATA-binding protein-associated factor Taf7